MEILKRNGHTELYDIEKIKNVIQFAFKSIGQECKLKDLEQIAIAVENKIMDLLAESKSNLSVELIQDQIEKTLTELNYYDVLKSFILYRNERSKERSIRSSIINHFKYREELDRILKDIQKAYPEPVYNMEYILAKFNTFHKTAMADKEKLELLVKSAVELITQEAPHWEFIAARIRLLQFTLQLDKQLKSYRITNFYEKVEYLTKEKLYGSYILEHYSQTELESYQGYIDEKRNHYLTYSGLELLLERYVIRNYTNTPLETPQEMFLGISLHLAMLEKNNRDIWVKRFYNMLSTLKVTMATPTLSNARKPYHQLSSCFIDTVPDSLDGIYRSIDNFAKVSKFGGGMGLYFGKVRASGSTIRGFKGSAGGVLRWIKLANDTAVAVDQLGVRQGAVAVYLDAWHKDLPEFLNLRTNNGDDRMKAHDVFPAVCYPDSFWQTAKENIDADWYLMCPHEVKVAKGYSLEDSYGNEWKQKYDDCKLDNRIHKRVIPIKEIIRLIIKSAVETGTPFTFNRDQVNLMNPNHHQGIIYCSNLCTEIAQNMLPIEQIEQRIETIDGETVVVTVTKPGEFVVCNLASLSLGHIDIDKENELATITRDAVRALDNVIDLNFFPVPYAKINNEKYRPIGLGVSGYHHMLAKKGIKWESQQHLTFVNTIFEDINYAAIKASSENAKEKGSYTYFFGSDWQTGAYFEKRNYKGERWMQLIKDIKIQGLRNGYLIAVAPTSSTSLIAGTTAGLDPIMSRYYLEEKKNGLMPRVAPNLSMDTFWLYKNAHYINQEWSIQANGVRQRHIDQAQSMNLYITNEYTFRQILNLYLLAWESGVKTIYYIRSKSLEVEDCDVCSS